MSRRVYRQLGLWISWWFSKDPVLQPNLCWWTGWSSWCDSCTGHRSIPSRKNKDQDVRNHWPHIFSQAQCPVAEIYSISRMSCLILALHLTCSYQPCTSFVVYLGHQSRRQPCPFGKFSIAGLCEKYKLRAPVSWYFTESMAASRKNGAAITKKRRPHPIVHILSQLAVYSYLDLQFRYKLGLLAHSF